MRNAFYTRQYLASLPGLPLKADKAASDQVSAFSVVLNLPRGIASRPSDEFKTKAIASFTADESEEAIDVWGCPR